MAKSVRGPVVAKPDPGFAKGDSAYDAARAIIATCLPVMRANEAGIIADLDPECLHAYRVALRKVRSVLSLFKGVFAERTTLDLKARCAAMMTQTNALRDLDVYLMQEQAYLALLPEPMRHGLQKQFAMLAAGRPGVSQLLAAHLQSADYQAEMAGLAKRFAKRGKVARGPKAGLGAHDYACALIWKRYRKIGQIAPGIGPDTEASEVHALRIECKKLRYLMEFFAPMFDKAAFAALLKPLKRLQDNLGRINDYAVQQVGLAAFLEKGGPGLDAEVRESVTALTTVLHQRQAEERARTVESLAGFSAAPTQRAFRDLFHASQGRK